MPAAGQRRCRCWMPPQCRPGYRKCRQFQRRAIPFLDLQGHVKLIFTDTAAQHGLKRHSLQPRAATFAARIPPLRQLESISGAMVRISQDPPACPAMHRLFERESNYTWQQHGSGQPHCFRRRFHRWKWYSSSSFTVDLNLTDGKSHQVLHLWMGQSQPGDSNTDCESHTGLILDTENISNFTNGAYAVGISPDISNDLTATGVPTPS